MSLLTRVAHRAGVMGLAAVAGIAIASAAQAAITTYAVYDHPEGARAGAPHNEEYGLRLDGTNPDSFFSFEAVDGKSLAQFVVDTGAGTATLSGMMRASKGTALWTVSATITGMTNIASAAGSWYGTALQGSLTNGSQTYYFVHKLRSQKYAFIFADEELTGKANASEPDFFAGDYRGDMTTVSGWVMQDPSKPGWPSPDSGSTNDFLFTVAAVPLPPAFALGLLGVAGLGAYRQAARRRHAQV